jgi:hypothetical protein
MGYIGLPWLRIRTNGELLCMWTRVLVIAVINL